MPVCELMHGQAMFATDDTFTNMEFKTPADTLVHDSFERLVKTPGFGNN